MFSSTAPQSPLSLLRLALRSAVLAALALLFTGCATLTGTPNQVVHIQTEDANGHPIKGMRCRASNGSEEYFGDSPMFNLQVRRSANNLEIECRRGMLIARGTAISRGPIASDAARTLLPGGTALLLIDHLSGYRYSYPAWVRLRAGQHLVFDADNDAGNQPTPGMHADASR
jgi:hypothetical protein